MVALCLWQEHSERPVNLLPRTIDRCPAAKLACMTPLLRIALIAALIMAALNIFFAAGQFGGISALPLWFYLVQLLLFPAFIFNVQLFPQASQTPDFARRVGLYALGWALPFGVYKISQDMLSPAFSLGVSLLTLLVTCLLFGVVMSFLRRPQQ